MTRAGVLVLIALCVLVHWPVDRAEFSFDDRDFVELNPLVASLPAALVGFAHPFPPGQPERALYRPLTGLSYALDVSRAGLDPHALHVTNVLLYTGLVLLVQQLGLAYGLGGGAALVLALLFAAHPVHCDAVDSISGRSEVLSLLFSVAALLTFLRRGRAADARAGEPPNLLSAALYAAACLSKESGAVLLAALLVHRVALAERPAGGRPTPGWALRPLAPHAAVLAAYALLRSSVLGRISPEDARLAGASFADRFWTMGSAFWLDFQQLLFPARLEVDFYYQIVVGMPARASLSGAIGWLAFACCAAAAALLAGRALRSHAPLAGASGLALCGLALLLVPLFPTSHVLDIGALFAERFLFAPSLGFVLLATLAARAGLARTFRPRAAALVGAVLAATLTTLGAARSHARALEWRDAVRLWSAASERLVDKRVETNLAVAYIARGQFDLALTRLDAALAIEPGYRPAIGNRGFIELQQGRLTDARRTFEELVASDPADARSWFNLGNVELAAGAPEIAAAHFAKALELEPFFQAAADGLAKAREAAQGPM